MTLQQLRYIVEIAKHNSISKAAFALYVTQPSISKAVQELEDELGITILERTNKGVIFTKDGTDLLSYAKILLDQAEYIDRHFNKQRSMDFLKLSISSHHNGFALEAIANLMDFLAERKYELTIRERRTTDVIHDVYTNRSSLGILSLANLNKTYFERYFVSKSLEFTPLASVRQHIFLRQEHPLAHHESIALEQLRDYPYLTYQYDDQLLHFAEEAIDLLNANKLVYLEDRGDMLNLLSHTNGYNLGNGNIVRDYMPANVISLPLHKGDLIQIGLIKRKDISLPEELSVFIDYLTAALLKAVPKMSEGTQA